MMIEAIAAGAPYRDVYLAVPDVQSLSLFVGYKRVGEETCRKTPTCWPATSLNSRAASARKRRRIGELAQRARVAPE